MTKATIRLDGLRTESHMGNFKTILTDAPAEYGGKGEYVSPTDLLGVALGACILTILAMMAKVDLKGAYIELNKEKAGKGMHIHLDVHLPSSIPADARARVETLAAHCPVHQCLNDNVKQEISFHWDV